MTKWVTLTLTLCLYANTVMAGPDLIIDLYEKCRADHIVLNRGRQYYPSVELIKSYNTGSKHHLLKIIFELYESCISENEVLSAHIMRHRIQSI